MAQIFDCRDCGREVRVTSSDDAEIVGNIEVVCGICAYQNRVEENEIIMKLENTIQELLEKG